jgi:hypothetical protein
MLKHLFITISTSVVIAQLTASINTGITTHQLNIIGDVVREYDTELLFNTHVENQAMNETYTSYPVVKQRSLLVEGDNTGELWADETQTGILISAQTVDNGGVHFLEINEPNLIAVGDTPTVEVTENQSSDLNIVLTNATVDTGLLKTFTYPSFTAPANPTVAIVPTTDAEILADIQRKYVKAAENKASLLSSPNLFQSLDIGAEINYQVENIIAKLGGGVHFPLETTESTTNLIRLEPETVFSAHAGVGINFYERNVLSLNAGLTSISGQFVSQQPADPIIIAATTYPAVTQDVSALLAFVEISLSHQIPNNRIGYSASIKQGFDTFGFDEEIKGMSISHTSTHFAVTYQV